MGHMNRAERSEEPAREPAGTDRIGLLKSQPAFVDQRPAAVAQGKLASLVAGSARMLAQQARSAIFRGETVQRQRNGAPALVVQREPQDEMEIDQDASSSAHGDDTQIHQPAPSALNQDDEQMIVPDPDVSVGAPAPSFGFSSSKPARKLTAADRARIAMQGRTRMKDIGQFLNNARANRKKTAFERQKDARTKKLAFARLPKTKIAYEAGVIGSGAEHEVVGKSMTAELHVGDPVVGTATGMQWVWTRNLRNQFPGAGVVRGHLLNHDLGGSAIPANLYPISTKANSEHSSKVEQPVKHLLNEAEKEHKQHQESPDQFPPAERVDYQVVVSEVIPGSPADAAFVCSFQKGSTRHGPIPIESKLQYDKARYSKNAGLIAGSEKISPHPKWQHMGSHANGDHAWVENLRRQQQLALTMAPHLKAEWPAETNLPQQKPVELLESMKFMYRDRLKNAGRFIGEKQDVIKFLLNDPIFVEQLKSYASVSINAIAGEWLKEEIEYAEGEVAKKRQMAAGN